MNLNPNGLSGEELQLSEDQSRVEGFLALRAAWKVDMELLKRRVSVVSSRVARGVVGRARVDGRAMSARRLMKRMVKDRCDAELIVSKTYWVEENWGMWEMSEISSCRECSSARCGWD